jgi:hypothetical protein
LFRRAIRKLEVNVLRRRHGDTPINRSPIPPGPKLERLCGLVELCCC